MVHKLSPLLIWLIASGQAAFGQETNILTGFKTNDDNVVAGNWTAGDNELKAGAAALARIVVRDEMPADYDLRVEFTRTAGDNSVGVILPVGAVSPILELSGWRGQAHGLSRVNGLPTRDPNNPTSIRPGPLENGKRYRLDISVRASGANPRIAASLDGEELFNWTGPASNLQPNIVLNLPEAGTLGLAAPDVDVTFHRVALRAAKDGKTTPPKPDPAQAPATGEIDLLALGRPGTPGWEPFNGAVFRVANDDSKAAIQGVPGAGAGDRGAFLTGVDFSEGAIELDLKGANQPGGSFLGVVFHGEDGDTYDSVYFRPFNFGNTDAVRRGHAVQYMSHPDWPWDKLRQQFPEEYENPAKPEPKADEWFRARIVVENGRVKAFVNGASEPCLDVKKVSETTSGKVGLWFNVVASFANLKIEPKS